MATIIKKLLETLIINKIKYVTKGKNTFLYS